uniref:helix-turn-helix domain-containing protein n=2 Tax=Aliiroseovarius crassostreae TaxID=154981 RepID=UPI0039089AB5
MGYLIAEHRMGAVYTQLSLQERRKIESWWRARVPVREMARVLEIAAITENVVEAAAQTLVIGNAN